MLSFLFSDEFEAACQKEIDRLFQEKLSDFFEAAEGTAIVEKEVAKELDRLNANVWITNGRLSIYLSMKECDVGRTFDLEAILEESIPSEDEEENRDLLDRLERLSSLLRAALGAQA